MPWIQRHRRVLEKVDALVPLSWFAKRVNQGNRSIRAFGTQSFQCRSTGCTISNNDKVVSFVSSRVRRCRARFGSRVASTCLWRIQPRDIRCQRKFSNALNSIVHELEIWCQRGLRSFFAVGGSASITRQSCRLSSFRDKRAHPPDAHGCRRFPN